MEVLLLRQGKIVSLLLPAKRWRISIFLDRCMLYFELTHLHTCPCLFVNTCRDIRTDIFGRRGRKREKKKNKKNKRHTAREGEKPTVITSLFSVESAIFSIDEDVETHRQLQSILGNRRDEEKEQERRNLKRKKGKN